MSDEVRVLLVILVGFASAGTAWAVTALYYQNVITTMRKEIAAERDTEQTEINNARIVLRTYGDMRGVDLADITDRGAI
jgi:hypothetical protein